VKYLLAFKKLVEQVILKDDLWKNMSLEQLNSILDYYEEDPLLFKEEYLGDKYANEGEAIYALKSKIDELEELASKNKKYLGDFYLQGFYKEHQIDSYLDLAQKRPIKFREVFQIKNDAEFVLAVNELEMAKKQGIDTLLSHNVVVDADEYFSDLFQEDEGEVISKNISVEKNLEFESVSKEKASS
jgi:hypothetical protein